MAAGKPVARETDEAVLVVQREFDAPRELVFDAFTDARHIGNWWGPRGFRTTTHEMDARPGGVWRYVMHGPDGKDYDNRVEYLEVARPERLSYRHGTSAIHPGEFRVEVTFADEGGKTRVTFRMIFPSAEECERIRKFGAEEGAHQTLERLAEHLSGPSG